MTFKHIFASGLSPLPGRLLTTCLVTASLTFSGAVLATEEPITSARPTIDKELPENTPQNLVKDGVSIDFEVLPDDGQDKVMQGRYANVKFRIKDAQSGEPIKGIYPAVWLDIAKPYETVEEAAEVTCKDRIALYMQGIVGVRPLVDLNSYFVLVLNKDASISVIDPIIGVGGITKLYASINLAGPGADWTKTYDEKFLYVSLPTKDQISKVDLTTFKVVGNVDAGFNPIRIALQPDERYIWVANNHADADKSGVTVIDRETDEQVKFIATGAGHHEIEFSHDNRVAYVSNRKDGSITIIDIARLEKIKTLQVSNETIDMAFSDKSEALYVTDGAAGTISVIDMNTHEIKRVIESKIGVGPIGVSQDGRWIVAANSIQDEVYAIDAATNKIKHTVAVGRKPYQLAFTRAFVFVRALGTERVSAIELAHLNDDKPVRASSFQAGPNAPGKVRDISIASAMNEAPGEAAILVVSPADNTVYYYMEGMNAPMGNFRNYGHRPRAVQVADRTLREEKDGYYQAKVRIPAAGEYDVAFLMETPSILHCFSMSAYPDPTVAVARTTGIKFVDSPNKVDVEEDVVIKFQLTDPATGEVREGLDDVRVRFYRAPAFDRQEIDASEVGGGIYQVKVNLKKTGAWYFFVSSKTANLEFGGDVGFHTLMVTRPVASAKQ